MRYFVPLQLENHTFVIHLCEINCTFVVGKSYLSHPFMLDILYLCGGKIEDFTLPHRVSLDSTWSPRGVVESLWSLCGLSFAGSSAKFMYKVPVESWWTPCRLHVGSMWTKWAPRTPPIWKRKISYHYCGIVDVRNRSRDPARDDTFTLQYIYIY